MKETHFYSNKLKALLFLLLSLIFVIGGFVEKDKILDFNEKLFDSLILVFCFLLFIFGIIFSILLLFRRKPLLTITKENVIIYNVLRTPIIVETDNIKSLFVVNNSIRGVPTNCQIYIELKKPSERYLNSWYYKLLFKISKPIANSQFAIQTDFLNVKQEELLEILNGLIKNNQTKS